MVSGRDYEGMRGSGIRKWWTLLSLATFHFPLVTLLTGCGHGDRLPTYVVSGKVVFADDKPLRGGTILFESESQPVFARGPIAEDGTFSVGTYEVGDGAVAGWHRVAVLPAPPEVDADEVSVPPPIDVKYQSYERSGLRFEIKADGGNHLTVRVTLPRK